MEITKGEEKWQMTWHDIKSLEKLCLYKTDAYAQRLREQKFQKEL